MPSEAPERSSTRLVSTASKKNRCRQLQGSTSSKRNRAVGCCSFPHENALAVVAKKFSIQFLVRHILVPVLFGNMARYLRLTVRVMDVFPTLESRSPPTFQDERVPGTGTIFYDNGHHYHRQHNDKTHDNLDDNDDDVDKDDHEG